MCVDRGSFQNETIPICQEKDVGVIGMKTLGGGPTEAKILRDTALTAEQCVRFALSTPVASVVRGWMSMEHLEADLTIAENFEPLADEDRQAILALAEPEAGDGRHELFKSTQTFDGAVYRKMHGMET